MTQADRVMLEMVLMMAILRLVSEDLVATLEEIVTVHDALADQADQLFMQRMTAP